MASHTASTASRPARAPYDKGLRSFMECPLWGVSLALGNRCRSLRHALLRRLEAAEGAEDQQIVADLESATEEERRGQGQALHQVARKRRRNRTGNVSRQVGDAARERTLAGLDDGHHVRLACGYVHLDQRLASKETGDRPRRGCH